MQKAPIVPFKIDVVGKVRFEKEIEGKKIRFYIYSESGFFCLLFLFQDLCIVGYNHHFSSSLYVGYFYT